MCVSVCYVTLCMCFEWVTSLLRTCICTCETICTYTCTVACSCKFGASAGLGWQKSINIHLIDSTVREWWREREGDKREEGRDRKRGRELDIHGRYTMPCTLYMQCFATHVHVRMLFSLPVQHLIPCGGRGWPLRNWWSLFRARPMNNQDFDELSYRWRYSRWRYIEHD